MLYIGKSVQKGHFRAIFAFYGVKTNPSKKNNKNIYTLLNLNPKNVLGITLRNKIRRLKALCAHSYPPKPHMYGVFFTVFAIFRALKKKNGKNKTDFFSSVLVA